MDDQADALMTELRAEATRRLRELLPSGVGYALVLVLRGGGEKIVSYGANLERDFMIGTFREIADKLEADAKPKFDA